MPSPTDALRKAQSIGPAIPGSDQPLADQGSPLTASSIPQLLARYGLDPTDLGNVGAGGHGMEAAIHTLEGPSEALLKALKPLGASLPRGQELAQELMQRGQMSNEPAVLAFDKLMSAKLPPHDIPTLVGLDKVTGARPPMRTVINAPEGFAFHNPWSNQMESGLLARRSPTLDAIDQVWNAADERALAKAPSSRTGRTLEQRSNKALRKLSDDQVQQIRSLGGTTPLNEIAQQFGVDPATIRSIIQRLSYQSVK